MRLTQSSRRSGAGACSHAHGHCGVVVETSMFRVKRVVPLFAVIVLGAPAVGRDDGRYASSPLKSWFESLHSEFGQCCTNADGYIVSDPDWDTDGVHYRVRIDNEWVDVPEA